MNAQQYTQYQQTVADFLRKNHVKPGCHSPKSIEPNAPFFSWRPCECCSRDLAGERETYTFVMDFTSGETFEADICSDCVYYLTYDRLDDTTMMEIEDSKEQDDPNDCPECARSFGPHYKGTCEH